MRLLPPLPTHSITCLSIRTPPSPLTPPSPSPLTSPITCWPSPCRPLHLAVAPILLPCSSLHAVRNQKPDASPHLNLFASPVNLTASFSDDFVIELRITALMYFICSLAMSLLGKTGRDSGSPPRRHTCLLSAETNSVLAMRVKSTQSAGKPA